MSSVLDERDAYLKSPYFKKHEYSDFSPFYITITVCTVIGLTIFLINVFLGCCSRYSEYWNDRHTGGIAGLYPCGQLHLINSHLWTTLSCKTSP
nr:unnamed protein product [Callosobruchus analis]CAI5863337.1 unnamed protein product [Callosobruchus analis]CAI5864838.1 unnamed protein product [Callosobruchus analis]